MHLNYGLSFFINALKNMKKFNRWKPIILIGNVFLELNLLINFSEFFIVIVLALYLLLVAIIFLNILIAIFTEAYSS